MMKLPCCWSRQIERLNYGCAKGWRCSQTFLFFFRSFRRGVKEDRWCKCTLKGYNSLHNYILHFSLHFPPNSIFTLCKICPISKSPVCPGSQVRILTLFSIPVMCKMLQIFFNKIPWKLKLWTVTWLDALEPLIYMLQNAILSGRVAFLSCRAQLLCIALLLILLPNPALLCSIVTRNRSTSCDKTSQSYRVRYSGGWIHDWLDYVSIHLFALPFLRFILQLQMLTGNVIHLKKKKRHH